MATCVQAKGGFREVALPAGTKGKLFLRAMPGRYGEDIQKVWTRARELGVDAIVRLAGMAEIKLKSPLYASALLNGVVPFEVLPFEIIDFDVPADKVAFWDFAHEVAKRLREGAGVACSCAAGRGRSGLLGMAVLLALGETMDSAEKAVSAAGAGPETPAQNNLVAWCASQTGKAVSL